MGWPVRHPHIFNIPGVFDQLSLTQKRTTIGNGLHVKVCGCVLLYCMALTKMKKIYESDAHLDRGLYARDSAPPPVFAEGEMVEVEDSQLPEETLTLDHF